VRFGTWELAWLQDFYGRFGVWVLVLLQSRVRFEACWLVPLQGAANIAT